VVKTSRFIEDSRINYRSCRKYAPRERDLNSHPYTENKNFEKITIIY
jgi:hypothetical protein